MSDQFVKQAFHSMARCQCEATSNKFKTHVKRISLSKAHPKPQDCCLQIQFINRDK